MRFAERRRQHARADALAIAAGLALPVQAWTPTQAEAAARGRRNLRLVLLTLIAIGTLTWAVVASDEGPEAVRRFLLLAPVPMLLAWAVARMTRPPRALPPHVDVPGAPARVELEVGEAAVTIRNSAAAHIVPFEVAEVAWQTYRVRDWTEFAGLTLATPFGPVTIDDRHFTGGRNAAAAIAGRLEAIGRLPPLPEA